MNHFNHISNLYPNYPQIELGKALLEITKFDKAFFCNSGTEANEGAIKFARKYFDRKGEKNRQKIVTFINSFHGRTFAALSATGQPAIREGFGSMPGDFVHVTWNDCEALKKEVNKDTCAIMLESLAAEGGVMTLSAEMVATINSLQKECGCLVIVDEVQAGVGRLGTFLGFEKYGLNPDLVSLAKGIGGGLPLGAVLLRQHIADQLKAGDHGTTFGGNPIACAAGLAVVKQIPYGKVATYGQVAALAGNPGWARVVGYALHVNPDPDHIPCFRVVNREGRPSSAFAFGGGNRQKELLEADGIVFVDGHVDMERFQWDTPWV